MTDAGDVLRLEDVPGAPVEIGAGDRLHIVPSVGQPYEAVVREVDEDAVVVSEEHRQRLSGAVRRYKRRLGRSELADWRARGDLRINVSRRPERPARTHP
jgi:hypothetical protein